MVGHVYTGTIAIDAITGKIRQPLRWDLLSSQHDPTLVVEDSSPVWTKSGLIFVSNRRPAGMPNWANFPPQLMMLELTGPPRYLTADLAVTPSFVAGLPNSSWISVQRSSYQYGIDLETGTYKELSYPNREKYRPALDTVGDWAVSHGVGLDESAKTRDLFADNLRRKTLGPVNLGRLVAAGEQRYPVFSPDGRWLYFVTNFTTQDKKTKVVTSRTTLDRVAHEVAETTKAIVLRGQGELPPNPFNLVVKDSETVVPGVPEHLNRLSFFPDSQRLLAQTDDGIFVISILDKKVTPLTLKGLADAELDGVKIQELKDGWAGPGNDRVTFSGMTMDKAGKTRWRIYSCRLDGTDIKAHTPKDNVPVEGYVFPDTKKTAIDLAKQWALGEIAWVDKQKRRGEFGN